MKLIFTYCLLIILSPIVVPAQLIAIHTAVHKVIYDQKPFIRHDPNASLHFLFIGDSTCVGTGAADPSQSVAGRFGQDFPQASIDNIGVNGRKLDGLIAAFNPSPTEHYNLVVVQIGGNDIMQLTSFAKIDREISIIIKRAKSVGRHVVILHSGNVGLGPIFIWPVSWVMTERARAMRALYMKKAKEEGVIYIDLFLERKDDLFLKDVDKYYSKDHLHPSGWGYKWWYDRIRATMDKNLGPSYFGETK